MSNSSLAYQSWVFKPVNMMTPEQRQQWFADCFLLTTDLEAFIYAEGAAVLVGETSSGKRVTLEKLEQVWQERAWLVRYRVDGTVAELDSPDQYFHQLMTVIARDVGDWLRQQLNQADFKALERLDEISLEFLLWFLPYYLGQYQSGRLWRRLSFALRKWEAFTDELLPPADLCHPDAHQDLIGELLELFHGFGFQAVLVIVVSGDDNEASFRPLFNNYSLLEQKDFFLRGVLLKEHFDISSWGSINGRVAIVHAHYAPAQVRDIGRRHLRIATNHLIQDEAGLANTAVWERGWQELERLHGRVDPAHWLKFVQVVLNYVGSASTSLPLQLETQEEIETILANYYRLYVPLRLDKQRDIVWRGQQPIELTGTLYTLLEALYQLKGVPGYYYLQKVAGNSANLHTQIKRLRQKIEPFDNCHVYITNSREAGYTLHTADHIFTSADQNLTGH